MGLFILAASVAGGTLLSSQSSINGALSRKSGTYETTFFTFITGALMLALLVLFFGGGDVMKILEAPAWQLSAVWFGVGYMFLTVLAVPQIGVMATNIATIIGQLGTGMLIDHFGWFGGLRIPLDGERITAFALLTAALWLMYKADKKPIKGT